MLDSRPAENVSHPTAQPLMKTKTADHPSAWKQILKQIESTWPSHRWRDVGVVIGCSGGADSVTLVRALDDLFRKQRDDHPASRGFLIVAHFNHQLRGKDSDHDAKFTADLAAELQLRFELAKADGSTKWSMDDHQASDHGSSDTIEVDSDEASLRDQRIRFLIQVAKSTGARYISLAHSADDNVETVLHHLMRGTGPAGLAGIGHPLSIDEDLVLTRPLIQTRRQVIRQALNEKGHTWREDQSNRDCRYRRNWIRNQLIPMMESEFPHAVEAMQRAIVLQKNWRQFIDQSAKQWLTIHLQIRPQITLEKDFTTDTQILIAAMQQLWHDSRWPRQAMTQGHWERLAAMIRGQDEETFTLPSGIRVTSSSKHVQLEPPD